MSQRFRIRRKLTVTGLLAMLLLGMTVFMVAPAAPAEQRSSSASANARPELHAQLQDVDAKISQARAHNAALQAQVTQMEQQNAAQEKRLQQRDAEIAALQQKLQAAGVSASAASTGH